MFKSFFSYLIFISIIFTRITLGQISNSIQINGGIISPLSSSKGLIGTIQFNYSLNSTFSFYTYAGYSTWDKYKIKFGDDRVISSGYGPKYFDSYSSNDHILIPLYLGSRINFHTNKLFTSYMNLELGYSYLTYNSYDQWKEINPETGEVLGYHPDGTTKKEIKENLFGLGIGLGLSHSMSENLNLVLSFKLNSFINSNYSGLFSTRGTYIMFLAGLNFNI